MWRNFPPNQIDIIIKALQFAAAKVNNYYEDAIKKEGVQHQNALSKKRQEMYDEINVAIHFLMDTRNENFFIVDSSPGEFDGIRSALEVYKRETSIMAEKYQIEDYTNEMNEIEKILEHGVFKDSHAGLFDKYIDVSKNANRKAEIFVSYSSKDKKIAGKISDIIKHDFDVFLAHRDIPLSNEWRDDILKHLESCSILLAICTPNYEDSAWGNQEVGIALGKGKKIIPLFAHGTDKKRFGLLSDIQGPTNDFTEENLEKIIFEIIKKLIPD